MTPARARTVHLVVAVVAWFALVLQLVLVLVGTAILDETDPPALPLRVARFLAYFTIQSNILVAIAATTLALDPRRDGRRWRVLRLAAVVGITVTGLVHFVLLRPLLDLEGADWAADKLLHLVVPVLAITGWAVFGPRPRITRREIAWALAWPVLWLGVTLVVGATTGWYPYPFLDHREDGSGAVVVACVGVTALFLVLFALASYVDRRAATAPRAD